MARSRSHAAGRSGGGLTGQALERAVSLFAAQHPEYVVTGA